MRQWIQSPAGHARRAEPYAPLLRAAAAFLLSVLSSNAKIV
jgi:hypothetical protein